MANMLISGGARGIGACMAKYFARRGHTVCILDIIPCFFEESNIIAFQADVGSEEEVRNVFRQISEKLGCLHVLINNAGISRFQKPLAETSVQDFDSVIAANLRGAFLCSREFVALNRGADFGRIINIASTRYAQNEQDWEIYGTSKGGLVSLTASLCVSLAKYHITVNAVSPGWIACTDYDKLSETDHSQHPSGRVGKPEDIARVCEFLCQKENDFINGANIPVDGGMTKRMIYFD